jgi:hypothetical protein
MSGKTFGEVFENFVIGLNEMCIMSDWHNMMVIGSRDKAKHELRLHDGCKSIIIVCTGTPGGSTGPTIFILKGSSNESMHKCFTNKFLVKNGCAPGSTILFNENTYMTDETWMQATQAIVRGYREMPFIKEKPVCELMDGFKSHKNVLGAHIICCDNNIISVKEESNTSHVNQAYDKLVAQNDKQEAKDALADQCKIDTIRSGKRNIDQYSLVLAACQQDKPRVLDKVIL